MANTRVQLEVEDWVRQHWFPQHYAQAFRRERLRLSSGGFFDFDAVSADNSIVASISTSSGLTAGGKNPAGKIQKLRADMLFLLMVNVSKRFIVLTEQSMYDLCLKEKANGRVPLEIEFVLAKLPEALSKSLQEARSIASKEVSPNKPPLV